MFQTLGVPKPTYFWSHEIRNSIHRETLQFDEKGRYCQWDQPKSGSEWDPRQMCQISKSKEDTNQRTLERFLGK